MRRLLATISALAFSVALAHAQTTPPTVQGVYPTDLFPIIPNANVYAPSRYVTSPMLQAWINASILGGNNFFTGANTASGPWTFNGPLTVTPPSLSAISVVSLAQYMTSSQAADVAANTCSVDIAPVFTAAQAALPNGKGTIQLPSGTMCVASPVVLNTGQYLNGQGVGSTTLKALPGACTTLIQTYAWSSLLNSNTIGGPYKFGFRDMTVDGNKANVTGTCNNIQTYGYDFVVSDVTTQNGSGQGWFSQWSTSGVVPVSSGGDSMEAHVTKLKTHDNASWGVMWQGPHDSVFSDTLSFLNNGGFACESSSTYGCVLSMTATHIYGNTNGGLYLVGSTITGSNFISESNMTGNGITIDSTSKLIASNVQTYNNFGSLASGIQISGGASNISGVTSNNNAGAGIWVPGNANVITGMQLFSNTGDGLNLTGTSNVVVGGQSYNNGTNYSLGTGNNTSALY